MQYYTRYSDPPKKCAMVAHFYETVAHFFARHTKTGQLCSIVTDGHTPVTTSNV